MGEIRINNILYSTPIQKVTQAEYDALGDAKNTNGVLYAIIDGESSSSGGTSKPVELTKAQYEALGDSVLNDNILYAITDGDELSAKNMAYDGSQTGLGNNVQSAIDNVDTRVSELNSKIVDLAMMSSRLSALESKFSTYVPVDTQTGTFSKTINNHSSASQTITFNPVFTNIPTVNAEYTNAIGSTHAGNISITVSDVTRYSCVITIKNNSTANFTFNMVWTAIADA